MDKFTKLEVDLEIKDGEWARHFRGIRPEHGYIERVGNLPNATGKGKPGFQLLAHLDDGTPVVLETTWALMYSAVRALTARWGEP